MTLLGQLLSTSFHTQVHEYDEWGDARDPSMLPALESLCPYSRLGSRLSVEQSASQGSVHHLQGSTTGEEGLRGTQLLVTCAIDDARVPVWSSAKWAARARRLQVCQFSCIRVFADSKRE